MADTTKTLKERLSDLKRFQGELKEIRKEAFMAAPPMPQGGAPMGGPPMDPAMMGAGGAPPMDPAMMGGPPMDPAMMGAPPMDPAMMGGPPMDPAMMGAGGAPPEAPMITPEMFEEMLSIVEEVAAGHEQQEKTIGMLQQQVEELAGELDAMRQEAAAVPVV
jgi:hypothetical protein